MLANIDAAVVISLLRRGFGPTELNSTRLTSA